VQHATKVNKADSRTTVIIIIIIIIIISNILVLHLLNEVCKHCKPVIMRHILACAHHLTPLRYMFFARKASCLSQWSTILHYLYLRFFLNVFHTGNGSTIDACFGPAATCGRTFLAPQPHVKSLGCYSLRCFNRLLLFSVLVDTVRWHVDADGRFLRRVVFKVTKPVP